MSINIKLVYRTPKSKYIYSRVVKTNYAGIDNAYLETSKKQAAKIAQKIERAKVSDGLRYDVLRRDMFRCVLCGASAQNGAELHVDHIVPIAKGGKTEMSNLRTLCDRCNRGKGSKYNPNGIN